MDIIIRIGGRWRDNKDVHILFNSHKTHISKTAKRLSRTLKFKLPDRLIVRPAYGVPGQSNLDGSLLWCSDNGYQLVLNYYRCRAHEDKGIDIINHELAHLACVILYRDFGHGKRWVRIYNLTNGKEVLLI